MSVMTGASAVRRLYCVLSARSLPYARFAFRSLFAHCVEPFVLTLITDGETDKHDITQCLLGIAATSVQQWSVFSKQEADERAAAIYAAYPAIRQFREGHPCWRKITDPPLFAATGEEMVILDPDLYFPNRFTFEATPQTGLALMWQAPSCLLPHDVVMSAYEADIGLAQHVDIGVAQVRNLLDYDWLEHLVGRLGGNALPRLMHIEAIVWAALAIRMGGGYLDPERWHCWRNAHWKRIARKMGVGGERLLALEPFQAMKCFHGGGVAKWWIPGRASSGGFAPARELLEPSRSMPFQPLTKDEYLATERLKQWVRRLGYYKLMGGASSN